MSAYTDADVESGAKAMCAQDARRCGIEGHEGCVDWEDDFDRVAYIENATAVLDAVAPAIIRRAKVEALRELADAVDRQEVGGTDEWGLADVHPDSIRSYADEIEAGS